MTFTDFSKLIIVTFVSVTVSVSVGVIAINILLAQFRQMGIGGIGGGGVLWLFFECSFTHNLWLSNKNEILCCELVR